MVAMERVKAALDPLGYDVRRWPGKTGEDTYIALTLLTIEPLLSARNRPLRLVAEVQVDLYTRGAVDALGDSMMRALTAAGLPIARVGMEQLETDTGYRHLPMVCQAPHDVTNT
ncbi:MAG: hypothetical protein PHY64_00945 [Eubacteriales bacterium]|nr:hypothetical protein [Eubacteriales bacterium]